MEAHGGPQRGFRAANPVSGVHKEGSNGLFMRQDFNHEQWLVNLHMLDMTQGGTGGTHEGSGQPHEGSRDSDKCCMSGKGGFMKAQNMPGIAPEAAGSKS